MRSELKTSNDIELSEEQLVAVNRSVNEPVSVITGGPGAGKTTMVLGLVSALEALSRPLKFVPRQVVLQNALKKIRLLAKYEPSTIHDFWQVPNSKRRKISM